MALTRLRAINLCLSGIGREPVASEDDEDLDAAMAATWVDQATEDLQSKGWWFNKEYDWELTPTINGHVVVPNSAMSVVTTNDNRSQNLAIRSNKLYDMLNHTYDMTERLINGKINVSFVIRLDFKDMPPIAKTAVAYIARRLFAQDLEVDTNRWRFQSADEERAYRMLEVEHGRNRKRNYFQNSTSANIINKVGGPNSGFYRDQIFPRRDSSGTS